jgi:hypothetical protein
VVVIVGHVIRRAGFGGYYWVLDQAEIVTDVMFCSRAALGEIMPDLVRHASFNMSSADVVRFLGRKLHPALRAEVTTDTKGRPEGWRVKHRLARNWIKFYDKASVLRVETTINNPREFRVLRVFTDDKGRRERRWTEMNKGVANMWRYYQAGMAPNRRYLDALAAAPLKGKGIAALDALCRPRTLHGRHHARFDSLRPADRRLFRALLAGGHNIVGFRNADLSARLYPRPPTDQTDAHRRCARVSRLIAKRRGHGLVAKVPHQRLYRVTPHGRRVLTAALVLHDQHFPDVSSPQPETVNRDAQILDRHSITTQRAEGAPRSGYGIAGPVARGNCTPRLPQRPRREALRCSGLHHS